MARSNFIVSIVALLFLLFGANSTFAQCGADGKQPCGTTTPKKTTTTKKPTTKPTTKPTVSKPTTTTKKTQKPVSKPQARFVARVPEIEMVKIPAGSFMMGSDNGEEDEKPVHRVNISNSFYMGMYEVTQAQWKAVMGNNPSRFSSCGGDCPVEQVSWDEVQSFIAKLNNLQSDYQYRLPTEAEWEYAARAGTTGDYYGNLDSIAWYLSNSGSKTHPVGQKQANNFGLYDMSGNVWEWCQDWYESYSSGAVTNPTGSTTGSDRVIRGGGWNDDAVYLRAANRDGNAPSDRNIGLGFRVVRN
ncbi:hypothetical protein BH10ACI1_BH10ACI1_17420 [soil metagenome]